MREATVAREDLATWAGFLLDHSLGGIDPDDRVMIKGERICWPLMAELERRVVEAGAVPDVCLIAPNNDRGRVWSAAVAIHGRRPQLDRVPGWHRERYLSMSKYVEVLGGEDPSQYATADATQLQALAAADRPFADIRLTKPWVITLYPTPAFAAMEGMDLDDYTGFIVRASTTDPRPLLDAERVIEPILAAGRTLEIATEDPRTGRTLLLTMDLGPSRALMSYGLRNFPDGEVFTSPDARSPEGEIFIDLPVTYGGHDISGIYLRFRDGRIVDFSSVEGQAQLAAIIGTDEGARRLGEVALGMNPGLDRVLKHPLFVEKVGGTLHIAIGASYDECFVEDPASPAGKARLAELEAAGVINRSAQHVDIVADFRPGGCGRRVAVDGSELRVADGYWVAAT